MHKVFVEGAARVSRRSRRAATALERAREDPALGVRRVAQTALGALRSGSGAQE